MKPGVKTTEFYMTLAAQVFGAVLASGAIPSEGPWLQLAGAVSAGLAAWGYTHSRGLAKSAPG